MAIEEANLQLIQGFIWPTKLRYIDYSASVEAQRKRKHGFVGTQNTPSDPTPRNQKNEHMGNIIKHI